MSASNSSQAVRAKIRTAISRFLKEDSYLLEVDAHEQAISNRLATHLAKEFPKWDTDCEYNRNLDQIKRLRIRQGRQGGQALARNVVPDIIVHRRSTNKNLLAVEIKKTSSGESDSYDLGKLRALRHELGYRYALFLKFKCGAACGLNKRRWVR